MQLTRTSIGLIAGALLLLFAGAAALAMRGGDSDHATTWITPLSVEGEAATVASPSAPRFAARPPLPPTPTPAPPRSLFERHQIVTYYGNPLSATMGILGEYSKEEIVVRIRETAATYQALNPDKTVIPALHLVYAVAQASPGADRSYLYHMPDEMVEGYIELTRQHNMLFFIDLQNGMKDPVEEARLVQHWMRHEHVHLAVDPEFTLKPHQNTRDYIGQLDGEQINQILDVLSETARDAGIYNKILIVHQFQDSMITNKELIRPGERADVVINMDGWGPPPGKLSKYEKHVKNEPVQYAGIKLFYRWDKPLMTPADVQALDPRPDYIQYQ